MAVSITLYVMVGYLPPSPAEAVYWSVYNTPDMVGAYSGFPGQLIDISISYTQLVSGPSLPSGVFSAGGDLSGTPTDQTVIGLQTRPLSATVPTTGQLLGWSGVAWTDRKSTRLNSSHLGI